MWEAQKERIRNKYRYKRKLFGLKSVNNSVSLSKSSSKEIINNG